MFVAQIKNAMAKRFRLSDESINSYGFRLLTSGCDLSDFKRNPVMLYNHQRAWRGSTDEMLPIGRWENIKIEGDEVLADATFDEKDEFAVKISNKVDGGFLNAASAGIIIIETTEDPKYLLKGQKYPTVTKWKVREASIVDIPSNRNCLALYTEAGDAITLSDGADNSAALAQAGILPLAHKPDNTPTPDTMEELKAIAATLGMSGAATLSDVQTKLAELKTAQNEVATLKAQLKQLEDAQLKQLADQTKSLLDEAVADNRITAAQRPAYEKLFAADFDSTKAIVDSLPKVVKLSEQPAGSASSDGKFTYNGKSFSQLSKDDPKGLAELKDRDFGTFQQLYKAEFGKDYKVTDR